MTRQHSLKRADHWSVGLWLIFDRDGSVRMTRGEPDCKRTERAMSLSVHVPHALFATPTLRAIIAIEAPGASVPPIDLTAAAASLKQTLGFDIDVTINAPGDNN